MFAIIIVFNDIVASGLFNKFDENYRCKNLQGVFDMKKMKNIKDDGKEH